MNNNYILVSIKKLENDKKKYIARFKNTTNNKIKSVKFGASGYSDFTIHKDKNRRDNYINRHKKDLKTNDYTKPGYLSMFILWSKPSLKASIMDFKKRIKNNNWTLPQ